MSCRVGEPLRRRATGVVPVVALVLMALLSACGQAFESVGAVTSVDESAICARFANGRELCVAPERFDATSGTPGPGDCIRVRFGGESARPMWVKRTTCAP